MWLGRIGYDRTLPLTFKYLVTTCNNIKLQVCEEGEGGGGGCG